MALPRYDSKDKGVPILDHRSTNVSWGNNGAADHTISMPEERTNAGTGDAMSTTDRARTVLANSRVAVLSAKTNGVPIGLVVPYALRTDGVPIVGCRPGVTTIFDGPIPANAQVSLAIAESPLTGSATNTVGGVTMLGILHNVRADQMDNALVDYAVTQPADAVAMKNGNGRLCLVEPTSLWVTVADGQYEAVDAKAFRESSPDPLAHLAPSLVAHLSNDQGTSLVLLCRAFGDYPNANAAVLSGIDQNGMDLMVTTAHGKESVRIAFGQPVTTPEEVRKELSAMIRGARFKLGMG